MPDSKKPHDHGAQHHSTSGSGSAGVGNDFNVFNVGPDPLSLDPVEEETSLAPEEEGGVLDSVTNPTQGTPEPGDPEFTVPSGAPSDVTITVDDGSGAPTSEVSVPLGAAAAATPLIQPAATLSPPTPSTDPALDFDLLPDDLQGIPGTSAPPSTPSPGASPAPAPSGVSVSSSPSTSSSPPLDLDFSDDAPGVPPAAREEATPSWLARHWIPATLIALLILITVAIVGVVVASGGSNSPSAHHPTATSSSSSHSPSLANTPGGQSPSTPTGSGSAIPGSSSGLPPSTPTGSGSATPGSSSGLPSTEGSGGATAAPAAPVITKQPQSQTCRVGQTATFGVTASGSPTPTIQWELSPDHGQRWDLVAGGTAPNYSVQCESSENGWEFRAVVTNAQGTVTSAAAGLGVA